MADCSRHEADGNLANLQSQQPTAQVAERSLHEEGEQLPVSANNRETWDVTAPGGAEQTLASAAGTTAARHGQRDLTRESTGSKKKDLSTSMSADGTSIQDFLQEEKVENYFMQPEVWAVTSEHGKGQQRP
ncbi:Uncharacterized protein TCM_033034 [Theobroma cacao]|uniref:Uncharacterized protein n=1 Tax=Theobroma cacao TaxID=3641 RepID=A0A061FHR4_THECC|nr:Uncharacterized protein TCM_033034 [Theobroma cacao]